ncbi:MAG TPA: hypothetical protein VKP89_07710 [Burkholderiales bacterium]|nr:hypothetical protein [Burkholderiales bacterium]
MASTGLCCDPQGRFHLKVQVISASDGAASLDRRHPRIRFRMIDEQDSIRRHMRIFVNGDQLRRLDVVLDGFEEIIILRR